MDERITNVSTQKEYQMFSYIYHLVSMAPPDGFSLGRMSGGACHDSSDFCLSLFLITVRYT